MGHGFWSYVRKDDAAMHGAIRRLAEHLKDEYELLSGGDELDLFFDSASLKWGHDWRKQIRQALEQTTLFIPIITPRYFKSEECRRELLSFAENAEELGLRRLVMPLYFADVPALEEGHLEDPAVKLVAECQYEDWRTLRLFDESVQPYRVAVNRLTTRLLELSSQSTDVAPQSIERPNGAQGQQPPHREQAEDQDVVANLPEAEEVGIFDLIAAGEEAFPRVVETIRLIGEEVQKVGDLTKTATEEIEQSDANGKGFRGRLIVMNRLAQKLTAPAYGLEELSSKYAADLLVLDPAMKQLIPLVGASSQEDPKAVEEFFETVRGMVNSSGTAAESTKGMIQAIEGNERFSRELGVPLKRMRVALQSMVDGQQLIESWRDSIDDLDQ